MNSHLGWNITGWVVAACLSAEMLGYLLHRLLHSGRIRFLSRSHMKHHMVLYGPLQQQRSAKYHDATDDEVSLGNIGLEWLIPAALLLLVVAGVFHLLQVRVLYQVIFLGTTLMWSFLLFSYLHDQMHVEGIWLTKVPGLKQWFLRARRLHDIHHWTLNDYGVMDKNFGIGFFLFDRLFGTLTAEPRPFNRDGYEAALKRFDTKHLDKENSNELEEMDAVQGSCSKEAYRAQM